jgi:hypothetical protein
MDAMQAKDFLVQQVDEQASLENVPLSSLERRMMYFVENDPTSCDKPLELNEEFEAHYDTPEYEAKMSGLLHRAYKRLKKENPAKIRFWDDSMRLLRRRDHYLPVLWANKPTSGAPQGNYIRPSEPSLAGYEIQQASRTAQIDLTILQTIFQATKGVFRPGPDDPKTWYGRLYRAVGLLCIFLVIAALIGVVVGDIISGRR